MSDIHDEREHGQELSTEKKRDSPLKHVFAPFKEALAAGQLGLGSAAWNHYQTTGQLADLNRVLEHFEAAAAQSPSGSRDRPVTLTFLGVGLRERYLLSGDPTDLNRAIPMLVEAARLMPLGSPGRPAALNNLGMGLHELYRRSGDPADLERAITAYEEAAQLAPTDSPNRPAILSNLASELRVNYVRNGNPTDLERAIAAHEEAAQLTPADSPNRSSILNNLGDDLRAQYARSGNVADLNRAIQVYKEAVQLTPSSSPKRPMHLSNLGAALSVHYTFSGDLGGLDTAIQLLNEAVKRTPPDSPDRPVYLNSLGRGLDMRYNSNGDLKDLERAIQAFEEAVQLTPTGSPDLPGWLTTLGVGLSRRYTNCGNPADLERAIQVFEEAVQQISSGSANRLMCLNNLGAALRMRYDRAGDLADLERAIEVYEEAVQQGLPGSPLLPACWGNLGAALRVRYIRKGDLADLNRAIQAYKDALTQLPPTSPSLPTYLNDLANGLRARFDYSGNLADLDSAIQVLDEAVLQSSSDSPALPTCLASLGNALFERYTRRGTHTDLERAIQVHEQSLQQTLSGSPNRAQHLNSLADDLSERFTRNGNPADLEQAVAHYEDACRDGMQADVEAALIAARSWGDWALTRKAWTEAARAYTYALDASDRLFRVQLLRSSKESWLREARNLHACAAYAFAQTGDLRRAVEALEHGHARLLSQTLERDRAELGQLQTLAPDVYVQYAGTANRVQALEAQDVSGKIFLSPDQMLAENSYHPIQPPGQVLVDTIRQAYADLDAAVKAVRQVPGYAEFLMPSTFAQIQQSIWTVPLVYVATTLIGGLALIIFPRNAANQSETESSSTSTVTIMPLWLNDLTRQTIDGRLLGEDDTTLVGYIGAYIRHNEDRHAWLTTLDETTHWLWDILMGPLTQTLTNLGASNAILIPQGALGLLPLHCAWTEDKTTPTGRRYALDVVTYSYVSNALALSAAQHIASRSNPITLLAIDEPAVEKVDALPYSTSEVEAARSYFSTVAVLRGEEASSSKLLAVLSADSVPDVWHFSCHGAANLMEPLASGLLLANNEWLTLRDLLALRLSGARLAVLSACETGIPGAKLPDEVVSLPTGLTQAGVAGIVASLWSVNELSTTLLLVRFYDFWQDEGRLPAEALSQAQRWVRDTTNKQKADYFKAFLPEFATGEPELATGKASRTAADDLYGALMMQDPEQYEFAHPYYWAAFGFTGI